MAEPPKPPKFDHASLPGYYYPPADFDPRPPYQMRGCTMLYVAGKLDPATAPRLPPPLRLPPEGWCNLILFYAPEGWGLAPFGAFNIAIDVDGHKSGDGNPGLFLAAGIYSGKAGQIMPRDYSPTFQAGEVGITVDGNHLTARADIASRGASIAFSATVLDQVPATQDGMLDFFAVGHDGGLIRYTNTHSLWVTETRDLVIDINLPLGHRLSFLKDFKVAWAVLMSDVAFTMGAPHSIAETYTDEGMRLAFLDVLAQLGRPIAIVEQSGRIAFMTSEAQAILHDDLGATVLRLPSATAGQPARGLAQPALLTLSSGRKLAARSFPIALRLGHGPLSLVLLTDPHEPGTTDPEPLLRLMGLTPSEAGLAAAIGAGYAPAEAARQRGITQSTARSTLKVIFQKLGIRRQVDLAHIVARLQGL